MGDTLLLNKIDVFQRFDSSFWVTLKDSLPFLHQTSTFVELKSKWKVCCCCKLNHLLLALLNRVESMPNFILDLIGNMFPENIVNQLNIKIEERNSPKMVLGQIMLESLNGNVS